MKFYENRIKIITNAFLRVIAWLESWITVTPVVALKVNTPSILTNVGSCYTLIHIDTVVSDSHLCISFRADAEK